MDLSVAWSEVDAVRREGHEIVISLQNSRRAFRFWCQSYSEAAVGEVIAQSLMQAARTSANPGTAHAAV